MKNQAILAHRNELTLKSLSNEVFPMAHGYRQILYELAKRGPQNIHNIAEFAKEDYPGTFIERTSIYRRINGTTKLFSMVEKEYIYPLEVKNRTKGNTKVEYHLTLKGFLAVLSTGLPIEETHQFQNLINLVCKPTKKKAFKELIKNYFKNCIKFFLTWHRIHGIQLTHQIGTLKYFDYFFANLNSSIPIIFTEHLKENEKLFFRNTLNDYVSSLNTIEVLQNIANPRFSKYYDDSKELELQKSLIGEFRKKVKFFVLDEEGLSEEFIVVIIQKWAYFLEGLQTKGGNIIFHSKNYENSQKIQPIFHFINDDQSSESKEIPKSNQIPQPYFQIMSNLEHFMSKKIAKKWALAYRPDEIMFGGNFFLFPGESKRGTS